MSLFYKVVRKYDFHSLIILLNLKKNKKKNFHWDSFFFFLIFDKLNQKICLDIKIP